MISRTYIRSLTGAATYNKGKELYEKKKVKSLTADFNSMPRVNHDSIIAHVEGSNQNIYEVKAFINTEFDTVTSIHCECPAFSTYSGLCKHCIAVLLTYRDAFASPAKKEPTQTTPALARLLQQKAIAKSLPIKQQDTYGKVHLEPYFNFQSGEFLVDFKIGISRMYVLKDVFHFIERIRNQEDYSYGRNLSFIHTEAAFDEDSRALLGFLKKWTSAHNDLHQPRLYYYNPVYSDKVRYLGLKNEEPAEFLSLLDGKTISGIVSSLPTDSWTIRLGHPPRKLTITGTLNGIKLNVTKFSFSLITEQHRIYFSDGKIYIEPVETIFPVIDFLNAMSKFSSTSAFIEKKDVPAFCQEFLPVLPDFFQCRYVKFQPEDYGMPTPVFHIYLDAPQKNMITCKPMVQYGENRYSIYNDSENIAIRDLSAELSLRRQIQDYANAFDPSAQCNVIVDDEEREYEFLLHGIPALQAVGTVYISDALKRMEIKSAPRVTVGISMESHLLELSLTAGDMSNTELLEILSHYNRKKKFYRLKDGSFVDAADSGLDTLAELKEGLALTDKQMRQDRIEVPKYRALYLDSQLKDNPVISSVKDRSFRSLVRNMKTIEDNDFEIPVSLQSVLREYQKTGFLWLKALHANGFGGILADDMGLGKTLQVIAFLLSEYQEHLSASEKQNDGLHNALIVAPASLVYNWSNEILRFAPELTPCIITGTAAERKEILANAGNEEILLTSYDLLKRDIQEYENLHFRYQFIDEAQYIKNPGTQAAKAVKEIHADFKMALTGTPVENRLSELWSIFDYLMPGFLYSYAKFRESIELPAVQNNDEEAMKRLQKMIRPFVLRRLKKDVLTDLPDKLEENMFARMNGEQQKLYDAHVKRMMLMLDKQSEEEFKSSKITILSELTRLRQICCDPALIFENYAGDSAKVEMCISLILNAIEGGHKILLFSQFTSMLDRLSLRLKQEQISFYMLIGSVSKEKRAQMVETFNKDDTSVFCISLKAGGTGLNLTAADIVIHFDPWWNLAVQDQATDRAHRIGQKNVVNVYKLIAKGTIEENILKLQEKKRELADQILNGEDLNGSALTKEDLMELLS